MRRRGDVTGYVARLAATAVLLPCLVTAATELRPADGGIEGSWPLRGRFLDTPQEVFLVTPALQTAKPLYLSIGLGDDLDSILTAALDESGGPGTGYDMLFVDANNNGDLTDDTPVPLKASNAGRGLLEGGPVNVTVKYLDGNERKIGIALRVDALNGAASPRSYGYRVTQHLEAKVDIGDRKQVLLGLYDAPKARGAFNGCFNDYGVDRFRIDLDGNGKLDAEVEEFHLSRVFNLDEKLWQLESDSAGAVLNIRPCPLAAGGILFRLQLDAGQPPEHAVVRMAAENGFTFTCAMNRNAPLKLPVGRYKATSQGMLLEDEDGEVWAADFSIPSELEIKAGADMVIELGSPLNVSPKIRGTLKPGRRISVSAELTGRGGETYAGVAPRSKPRPRPEVKVLGGDGAVLTQGKMSYG